MADHFRIMNTGIIDFGGALVPGWVCNLGISLAAGTVTIADAGGTALSTTNPGWVACNSTTAGQLVCLEVTANATFNDDSHASSDLTNLGFGITEAAAWANDMPYFLYVVNRSNSAVNATDGNSKFFIARNPCMTVTPSAAGNIGDTGAIPTTDNQNSILILADVTVANYTSLPCQLIGAFRMQWSAVNTDWTVQAFGQSDGIGSQALQKTFATDWTMPLGQNGASASTYILPNGGTAPVFITNSYVYTISINGYIKARVRMSGDGGTDGAGAVETMISLPATKPSTQLDVDSAFYVTEPINGSHFAVTDTTAAAVAYFQLTEVAGTASQLADFSNGSRDVIGNIEFKAFATSP